MLPVVFYMKRIKNRYKSYENKYISEDQAKIIYPGKDKIIIQKLDDTALAFRHIKKIYKRKNR